MKIVLSRSEIEDIVLKHHPLAKFTQEQGIELCTWVEVTKDCYEGDEANFLFILEGELDNESA